MNWKRALEEYRNYLVLEKALSDNTVEAYLRDVTKLSSFCVLKAELTDCTQVTVETLRDFIVELHEQEASSKSQARIISGIKSFFHYLSLENIIEVNPTDKIDRPRLERKLPDTLSPDDINDIINSVDLSNTHGERNRTLLETLYSCGLRVSELINLQCSKLFLDEGFLIVIDFRVDVLRVKFNYLNEFLEIRIKNDKAISERHQGCGF